MSGSHHRAYSQQEQGTPGLAIIITLSPIADPLQTMRSGVVLATSKASVRLHQRYSSEGRNRRVIFLAMALNIKDATTDRLVRELAAETGESLTTAVTASVRERLERLRGAVPREQRARALNQIAVRSAARPIADRRTADEIVDYDSDGLPV
jgi:antitoxin VapB